MSKFQSGDKIRDVGTGEIYTVKNILVVAYTLITVDGREFTWNIIEAEKHCELLLVIGPKFKKGDLVQSLISGKEAIITKVTEDQYEVTYDAGGSVDTLVEWVDRNYRLVGSKTQQIWTYAGSKNVLNTPQSLCYEEMYPEGGSNKTENKAITVEEERDQYLKSVLGDWLDLVSKGE